MNAEASRAHLMNRPSAQYLWRSRWAFVLAATGSAVGLGNIWKFPYITGEYGGGAFVLLYLLCIFLIGIPLLMAEIAIGRRGRGNPMDALARVAVEGGASRHWGLLGALAMLCGFLILCFYVVVAGWAFAYTLKMAAGTLSGGNAAAMQDAFAQHNADPWQLGGWSLLVGLLTLLIVGRGIQQGIERAVRWLMPGLVLLLLVLVLVGYDATTRGFAEGVSFLFRFEASRLSGEAFLAALGHAFFTLSLASGAIMAYSAYLPDRQSVVQTSLVVALADTAVALLAGLAIFPVIFANDMSPASGPGLLFMSLPLAFQQMPLGQLFGTLFFAMVSIAALTSAISILEGSVAWLSERRGISRRRAAWLLGVILVLISQLTMLSFNLGAGWTLAGMNLFDTLDYLTARWMMPLGGILLALLVGYRLQLGLLQGELRLPQPLYALWLLLLRYVSPLLIFMVFLHALGWLGFDPLQRWYWVAGACAVLALLGEWLTPGVRSLRQMPRR